jgi:hypothetical protein
MNSPRFAQLLLVNREVRLPAVVRAAGPAPRLSCLMQPHPPSAGPIRPALADLDEFPGHERRRSASAIWVSAVVLAFACVVGLFSLSLARVHRVRQAYEVSVQLRQRERELHQVQRAYRALEAYVATQAARDFQQPQLTKVSTPPAALKRTNRS